MIKSENQSLKIARYNDSLPLEDFIQKSSIILKQDGVTFCYDSKQIAQIIVLLQKYKFNLESLQFVHPKFQKMQLWF